MPTSLYVSKFELVHLSSLEDANLLMTVYDYLIFESKVDASGRKINAFQI